MLGEYVTLHVRGTPERLDDALPVLHWTDDHFEAAAPVQQSLDRMGQTARGVADQVVAFRLRARSWQAVATRSQTSRLSSAIAVLAGLEGAGPVCRRSAAGKRRSG